MTAPLPLVDMPEPDDFVDRFVGPNLPAVIDGIEFDQQRWALDAVRRELGQMTVLVYGSLFDLEDLQPLDDYLDDWFGVAGIDDDDEVPYVRWYNKLREVDFAWGDDALAAMADGWTAPRCLTGDGYLLPADGADPTIDPFPYRGLLVAARGSRTRLHRDPFFSDAVVCQFAGAKDAVLYHPDRVKELTVETDSSSFGGFLDIRDRATGEPTIEPDYRGVIRPGQMIYVPHGWLHDVLVVEDSLSITWNFIHRAGAAEHRAYLEGDPRSDSEFEILQYFHALSGRDGDLGPQELLDLVDSDPRFAQPKTRPDV